MEIPDQNQHFANLLTKDVTSQDHGGDQCVHCVFFCLFVCNGLLVVGTGQQLEVELSWGGKKEKKIDRGPWLASPA